MWSDINWSFLDFRNDFVTSSLRSLTHSKDINTSLLTDFWQSSHLPMWESVSEVRSICCHASFSLVLLKGSRSFILLFVWHCCSSWLNDWKQHDSSLAGLSLCHNWWGSVITAVELDKLCRTGVQRLKLQCSPRKKPTNPWVWGVPVSIRWRQMCC